MKTNEQQQIEFEEYVHDLGFRLSKTIEGGYQNPETQLSWEIWQEQERRHADDRETVRLIEKLRACAFRVCIDKEHGRDVVEIMHWAYARETFIGDSLLDCLRKAVAAKGGGNL